MDKKKISHNKSQSKYQKTEKGKDTAKRYRKNHPEKIREWNKKYKQKKKSTIKPVSIRTLFNFL